MPLSLSIIIITDSTMFLCVHEELDVFFDVFGIVGSKKLH